MNKTDIVKMIAARLNVMPMEVLRVVSAYEEEIQSALVAGEEVTIRGVVRLTPAVKPAAVRRNPRTGEQIKTPEGMPVKAKVFKSLKDQMK